MILPFAQSSGLAEPSTPNGSAPDWISIANKVSKASTQELMSLRRLAFLRRTTQIDSANYSNDPGDDGSGEQSWHRPPRIRVVALEFGIRFRMFQKYLLWDAIYGAIALVLVTLCLWIYSNSFAFTVLTLCSITFSLGTAYWAYRVALGLQFFPFINLLAAILALGIGADDALILHRIWSSVKLGRRQMDRRRRTSTKANHHLYPVLNKWSDQMYQYDRIQRPDIKDPLSTGSTTYPIQHRRMATKERTDSSVVVRRPSSVSSTDERGMKARALLCACLRQPGNDETQTPVAMQQSSPVHIRAGRKSTTSPGTRTLERIMTDTIAHAAVSMTLTSMTTAAAFLVNLGSPVVALRCFGLYAALTVTANLILVLTWLPAALVYVEQRRGPTCLLGQEYAAFADRKAEEERQGSGGALATKREWLCASCSPKFRDSDSRGLRESDANVGDSESEHRQRGVSEQRQPPDCSAVGCCGRRRSEGSMSCCANAKCHQFTSTSCCTAERSLAAGHRESFVVSDVDPPYSVSTFAAKTRSDIVEERTLPMLVVPYPRHGQGSCGCFRRLGTSVVESAHLYYITVTDWGRVAFEKLLPCFVVRCRLVWILLLFGVTLASAYVLFYSPGLKLPTSDHFGLLHPSNPLEAWYSPMTRSLSPSSAANPFIQHGHESSTDALRSRFTFVGSHPHIPGGSAISMPVRIVWGVAPRPKYPPSYTTWHRYFTPPPANTFHPPHITAGETTTSESSQNFPGKKNSMTARKTPSSPVYHTVRLTSSPVPWFLNDSLSIHWLDQFCARLALAPFISYTSGASLMLPHCFASDFLSWMRNRPCVDPVTGESRAPCCADSAFPFPPEVLTTCLYQAAASFKPTVKALSTLPIAGPLFLKDTRHIRALIVEFQARQNYSFSYPAIARFRSTVDRWLHDALADAPATMRAAWFTSELQFFDLQRSLAVDTGTGVAIALSIALVVVLVATRNVLLSLQCVISIGAIILTTFGALVMFCSWELNVLESTILILTVGLSFDYTLHYAVAYKHSSPSIPYPTEQMAPSATPHVMERNVSYESSKFHLSNNIAGAGGVAAARQAKVAGAIELVGSPVAMSALTTLVAGVCMLPASTLAYTQIGAFMVFSTSISWLYSTFLFTSLLSYCGPTTSHSCDVWHYLCRLARAAGCPTSPVNHDHDDAYLTGLGTDRPNMSISACDLSPRGLVRNVSLQCNSASLSMLPVAVSGYSGIDVLNTTSVDQNGHSVVQSARAAPVSGPRKLADATSLRPVTTSGFPALSQPEISKFSDVSYSVLPADVQFHRPPSAEDSSCRCSVRSSRSNHCYANGGSNGVGHGPARHVYVRAAGKGNPQRKTRCSFHGFANGVRGAARNSFVAGWPRSLYQNSPKPSSMTVSAYRNVRAANAGQFVPCIVPPQQRHVYPGSIQSHPSHPAVTRSLSDPVSQSVKPIGSVYYTIVPNELMHRNNHTLCPASHVLYATGRTCPLAGKWRDHAAKSPLVSLSSNLLNKFLNGTENGCPAVYPKMTMSARDEPFLKSNDSNMTRSTDSAHRYGNGGPKQSWTQNLKSSIKRASNRLSLKRRNSVDSNKKLSTKGPLGPKKSNIEQFYDALNGKYQSAKQSSSNNAGGDADGLTARGIFSDPDSQTTLAFIDDDANGNGAPADGAGQNSSTAAIKTAVRKCIAMKNRAIQRVGEPWPGGVTLDSGSSVHVEEEGSTMITMDGTSGCDPLVAYADVPDVRDVEPELTLDDVVVSSVETESGVMVGTSEKLEDMSQ